MKLNSLHEAAIRENPEETWRYLYTFELPRTGPPLGKNGSLNPFDEWDPLVIDARRVE